MDLSCSRNALGHIPRRSLAVARINVEEEERATLYSGRESALQRSKLGHNATKESPQILHVLTLRDLVPVVLMIISTIYKESVSPRERVVLVLKALKAPNGPQYIHIYSSLE